MAKYLIFIFVVFALSCSRSSSRYLLETSTLKIEKIGEHTYQHISYIDYKGNAVGCNGVFAVFGDEAIIIDSPTDDAATIELLEYIKSNFQPTRIVAIPNHFHSDCTGGFKAMLDFGVVIYAYSETIKLMEDQEIVSKVNPFYPHLDMQLGNGEGVVFNRYFGPAHTQDNIASYILPDSILFGGCMVKSIGASKGNLADANTSQWSKTISNMKQGMFGNAKLVVPGHGKVGGVELLDYTQKLFEQEK